MLSALRLSSSLAGPAWSAAWSDSPAGRTEETNRWGKQFPSEKRNPGIQSVGERWWLTASSSWLRERNLSLWLEMMESRESIWPWGSSGWGPTPEPGDMIYDILKSSQLRWILWSKLRLLSVLFNCSEHLKSGLHLDCHMEEEKHLNPSNQAVFQYFNRQPPCRASSQQVYLISIREDVLTSVSSPFCLRGLTLQSCALNLFKEQRHFTHAAKLGDYFKRD